jgi:hypothetical protein
MHFTSFVSIIEAVSEDPAGSNERCNCALTQTVTIRVSTGNTKFQKAGHRVTKKVSSVQRVNAQQMQHSEPGTDIFKFHVVLY